MYRQVFDPNDFYELAKLLEEFTEGSKKRIPENLREATYRTCISRYYYSMFLLVRALILSIRFKDKKTKEHFKRTYAHLLIPIMLHLLGDEKASLISEHLLNLRDLRNSADYDDDHNITYNHLINAKDHAKSLAEILSNQNIDEILNKVNDDIVLKALKVLEEKKKRSKIKQRFLKHPKGIKSQKTGYNYHS